MITKFSNLGDWENNNIRNANRIIKYRSWLVGKKKSLVLFLNYNAYETFWNYHGST